MGYLDFQLKDLGETIGAVDCDTLSVASPVDLGASFPSLSATAECSIISRK